MPEAWTDVDPNEEWEVKKPDALPPDWWPMQCRAISQPRWGQYEYPSRQWTFRIPHKESEGGWFILRVLVPDNIGPTTKAGKYSAALMGMEPTAGLKFTPGQLLGRWCRARLEVNPKGYNVIAEMQPGTPPPDVEPYVAPSPEPTAQPATAPAGLSPEMAAAVAAFLAQQQEQAATAAAEAVGRVAEPASEQTVMDAPHPAGQDAA